VDLSNLNEYELIALTRALHEARFPELENDPAVWGSPFVIELHCQAIEEQQRRLNSAGDERGLERLRSWLVWRGRHEHQVVTRRLRDDATFRKAVLRDPEVLRDRLRPFVVDDRLLQETTETAAGFNTD